MTLEGFRLGLACSAALSLSPGFPWAKDILKKNRLTRLKAATNKDLDRPDTILSSKFGAKIGGEGQIMKTGLKNRIQRSRNLPFRAGGLPKLHLMQFGIKSAIGQQLFVGADLPDLALIENDDLVGLPDRRQPVGNHD